MVDLPGFAAALVDSSTSIISGFLLDISVKFLQTLPKQTQELKNSYSFSNLSNVNCLRRKIRVRIYPCGVTAKRTDDMKSEQNFPSQLRATHGSKVVDLQQPL